LVRLRDLVGDEVTYDEFEAEGNLCIRGDIARFPPTHLPEVTSHLGVVIVPITIAFPQL
jgi:hypothetical protein